MHVIVKLTGNNNIIQEAINAQAAVNAQVTAVFTQVGATITAQAAVNAQLYAAINALAGDVNRRLDSIERALVEHRAMVRDLHEIVMSMERYTHKMISNMLCSSIMCINLPSMFCVCFKIKFNV